MAVAPPDCAPSTSCPPSSARCPATPYGSRHIAHGGRAPEAPALTIASLEQMDRCLRAPETPAETAATPVPGPRSTAIANAHPLAAARRPAGTASRDCAHPSFVRRL